MREAPKPRPEFRNINVFADLPAYRMPAAAWVSILHRASGGILFALLPFIVWLFDTSLSSEISYGRFTSAFHAGLWFFPAWLVKLVVWLIIWAYLHHFIAGVRHLYMDATHSVSKEFGRTSALVTLVSSVLLTLILGAKLFGLF